MLSTFVAIDFETANNNRSSAIEVALARVESGNVTATWSSLIKPAPEYEVLGKYQFKQHGISQSRYLNAPTFKELWPTIEAFIGNDPLVAHSAAFDRSVLMQTAKSWDVAIPTYDFYCSVLLCKATMNATDYQLPSLVALLNLPAFNHHEALADALACANLVLEISKQHGDVSRNTWLIGAPSLTKTDWTRNGNLDQLRAEVEAAQDEKTSFFAQDPKNLEFEEAPLAGINVCVARKLFELSDDQARLWVEALGGNYSNLLSAPGDIDIVLEGSKARDSKSDMSVEVRAIIGLKKTGIEFMSENDFFELAITSLRLT